MALEIGNISGRGTIAQYVYDQVWTENPRRDGISRNSRDGVVDDVLLWDPLTIEAAGHTIIAQRTSGGATPLKIISVDGQAYNSEVHDPILNQPYEPAASGTVLSRALSSAFTANAAEAQSKAEPAPVSVASVSQAPEAPRQTTAPQWNTSAVKQIQIFAKLAKDGGFADLQGKTISTVDGVGGRNTGNSMIAMTGHTAAQLNSMSEAQYVDVLKQKMANDLDFKAAVIEGIEANPALGAQLADSLGFANTQAYLQSLGVSAPGPASPPPGPNPPPAPSPAQQGRLDVTPQGLRIVDSNNQPLKFSNDADVQIGINTLKNIGGLLMQPPEALSLEEANQIQLFDAFFEKLEQTNQSAEDITEAFSNIGLSSDELQIIQSAYLGNESPYSLDMDVATGLRNAVIASQPYTFVVEQPNIKVYQQDRSVAHDSDGNDIQLQISDIAGIDPTNISDPETANVVGFLIDVGALEPMSGEKIGQAIDGLILAQNPQTPEQAQAMFDAIKQAYETHVPSAEQDPDVQAALAISAGNNNPEDNPSNPDARTENDAPADGGAGSWSPSDLIPPDIADSLPTGVMPYAIGAVPIIGGTLLDRRSNRRATAARVEALEGLRGDRDELNRLVTERDTLESRIDNDVRNAGTAAANSNKDEIVNRLGSATERRGWWGRQWEGTMGVGNKRADARAQTIGAVAAAEREAGVRAAVNADGTPNTAEQDRIRNEANDKIASAGAEANNPGLIRRGANRVSGALQRRTDERQTRLQAEADDAANLAEQRVNTAANDAEDAERGRLNAELDTKNAEISTKEGELTTKEQDINRDHPERGRLGRNKFKIGGVVLGSVLGVIATVAMAEAAVAISPETDEELGDISQEALSLAQEGRYEEAGQAIIDSATGDLADFLARHEAGLPGSRILITSAMAAYGVGDLETAAELYEQAGANAEMVTAISKGEGKPFALGVLEEVIGHETISETRNAKTTGDAVTAYIGGISEGAIDSISYLIDGGLAFETTSLARDATLYTTGFLGIDIPTWEGIITPDNVEAMDAHLPAIRDAGTFINPETIPDNLRDAYQQYETLTSMLVEMAAYQQAGAEIAALPFEEFTQETGHKLREYREKFEETRDHAGDLFEKMQEDGSLMTILAFADAQQRKHERGTGVIGLPERSPEEITGDFTASAAGTGQEFDYAFQTYGPEKIAAGFGPLAIVANGDANALDRYDAARAENPDGVYAQIKEAIAGMSKADRAAFKVAAEHYYARQPGIDDDIRTPLGDQMRFERDAVRQAFAELSPAQNGPAPAQKIAAAPPMS